MAHLRIMSQATLDACESRDPADRIDEVWYGFDCDFCHWRGPVTDNRMAMTRACAQPVRESGGVLPSCVAIVPGAPTI
jgi:hypothetical protein